MSLTLLNRLFGGRGSESARAASWPADPLDLHAFAERHAQVLRAAWPQARVRLSFGAHLADTRIDWSLADGFADTQFVGDGYRRYLAAPAALEQVLAEQVAAAREARRRFERGA